MKTRQILMADTGYLRAGNLGLPFCLYQDKKADISVSSDSQTNHRDWALLLERSSRRSGQVGDSRFG